MRRAWQRLSARSLPSPRKARLSYTVTRSPAGQNSDWRASSSSGVRRIARGTSGLSSQNLTPCPGTRLFDTQQQQHGQQSTDPADIKQVAETVERGVLKVKRVVTEQVQQPTAQPGRQAMHRATDAKVGGGIQGKLAVPRKFSRTIRAKRCSARRKLTRPRTPRQSAKDSQRWPEGRTRDQTPRSIGLAPSWAGSRNGHRNVPPQV